MKCKKNVLILRKLPWFKSLVHKKKTQFPHYTTALVRPTSFEKSIAKKHLWTPHCFLLLVFAKVHFAFGAIHFAD